MGVQYAGLNKVKRLLWIGKIHTAWLGLCWFHLSTQPNDFVGSNGFNSEANLTSMSEDCFPEAGFSSQDRLEYMLAGGARV